MNEYVGNYRFHCSICGRFVGKDGIINVFEYEEGYHYCREHIPSYLQD